MKKKGITVLCALLLSALSIVTLNSCDKDTKSYLDVTVIDQSTGLVVADALVQVTASGSTIGRQGYTNLNGVYSTDFSAPAVFDIRAQMTIIDTPAYPLNEWHLYRSGSSSIRLKESETVSTTVYIDDEIHYERLR